MAPLRRSARGADKPEPPAAEPKIKKASKATKAAAKAVADNDAKAAVPAKKGKLAVGDQLPHFELEADTSTADAKVTVSSKDLTKDTGAIIFFYPKANTGGCTKQAIGFNENAAKLDQAGYKVYGMSADKPKSQANWKKKYSLESLTLLSDPSYEVLRSLGVTKGPKQIARSHLVIGKGGKLEDIHIGISPGDSFATAVNFAKTKK